ncbi:hypothetical protein QFZ30_002233 [Arthrobacter pascens]|nr:hypothetical protein [Arthrobacter pascens]
MTVAITDHTSPARSEDACIWSKISYLMDEAGKPAEYSMSAARIREILQAKCDARAGRSYVRLG